MGNLILDSLEIRNFRGFQHLAIERLGRVNLIVGKNNIGKSNLLEALQLYAQRGSSASIDEALVGRDPSIASLSGRIYPGGVYVGGIFSGAIPDNLLPSVRYLFYGRKDIKDALDPIQIGSMNGGTESLIIELGWYTLQLEEGGIQKWRLVPPEEFNTVDKLYPRLILQFGGQTKIEYPPDLPNTLWPSSPRLPKSEYQEINYVSIGANGLDRGAATKLWEDIALTDLEKEVLKSLQLIAPGVEGLGFIKDSASPPVLEVWPRTQGEVERRIPIVTVEGVSERLPIRTLGQGMQRMLGIALALANTKDGLLLIDEIENGIHFSVERDLWQLIFQLAHRLNVQVFATTHSMDCIKGFQEAAQEQKQEKGVLIQLGYKKNVVNATLFDEEELGIAVRQQIEVR